MFADGMLIKRESLQRKHPAASPAEIDRLILEWLAVRPMDAPGRVRVLRSP